MFGKVNVKVKDTIATNLMQRKGSGNWADCSVTQKALPSAPVKEKVVCDLESQVWPRVHCRLLNSYCKCPSAKGSAPTSMTL